MYPEERNDAELRELARLMRIDIVEMLTEAKSGHPGGSLSAIDILTALFTSWMKHDPENPRWEGRDRFVLSKGHAVPALYAVLSRCGYIPHEELTSLRKLGSRLQGHPDPARLDCLEAATGALGQGLSVAQGMALASKLDGSEARVYCMIGDGETQEGQIWEAAMSAGMYKIDNLCAILDYNGAQIDGYTKDVMDLDPIVEKWEAFNWNVIRIDGHDLDQIFDALAQASATKGKPTMIVADTVKGKGVSFMEGDYTWHGVTPSAEQCEQAVAELNA